MVLVEINMCKATHAQSLFQLPGAAALVLSERRLLHDRAGLGKTTTHINRTSVKLNNTNISICIVILRLPYTNKTVRCPSRYPVDSIYTAKT